jgi:hypothetical protein
MPAHPGLNSFENETQNDENTAWTEFFLKQNSK